MPNLSTMKRLLDIILILLTLPFWLFLFIFTWLVVRITLGAPVFFCQERAGLNGRPFKIIKFRTMVKTVNEKGELLPDEKRLTPTGFFLRNLSLDELPELFNVLRGEMSLVGPRPLPIKYVLHYTDEQARRLFCMPGITGWAQVNGRNLLDWEDRFAHDIWYVDNRNLWLDLKILCMTLVTVISCKGISAENAATMTEFMGAESAQAGGHPDSSPQPDCPDPSRKNE